MDKSSETGGSGGGCPVQHGSKGGMGGKDFGSLMRSSANASSCPVDHAGKAQPKAGKVYNVYSQEIDPSNMMPADVAPNQLPVSGQSRPLETSRVSSSIPKGGTDSTWTYPSPQMFYNALTRKGKAGDMTEEDATTMVAIHNNMNERTWRKVLDWEAKYAAECPHPTLRRFKGRPDELSWRARAKVMLGGPRPFDRHDWVVDRCGREVRYIIDYYHEDGKDTHLTKLPEPTAADTSVQSITLHVRPALDSMQAFLDVSRSWLGGFLPSSFSSSSSSSSSGPSSTPAGTIVDAAGNTSTAASRANVNIVFPATKMSDAEFSFLSSLNAPKAKDMAAEIASKCSRHAATVRQLEENKADEAELQRAQLGMQFCVGSIVAPEAADAALAALKTDADPSAHLEELDNRVNRFMVMANKVVAQAAVAAEAEIEE